MKIEKCDRCGKEAKVWGVRPGFEDEWIDLCESCDSKYKKVWDDAHNAFLGVIYHWLKTKVDNEN